MKYSVIISPSLIWYEILKFDASLAPLLVTTKPNSETPGTTGSSRPMFETSMSFCWVVAIDPAPLIIFWFVSEIKAATFISFVLTATSL